MIKSLLVEIENPSVHWVRVFLLGFSLFFASSLWAKSIYVAAGGSDSSSGLSSTSPLRTLDKAVQMLSSGDSLFLKAGDSWVVSSTLFLTESDITINVYGGSGYAILDGRGSYPTDKFGTLLAANGARNNISNLEFRNSGGHGVVVRGNYTVLDNIKVTNPHTNGILVDKADGTVVNRCEVVGANSGYPKGTLSPWGAAINIKSANGFKVTNCKVHEGWGEGIMPWLGSNSGVISGNTVYAQHAVGIYIGGYKIDVFNNVVLGTSVSKFWRTGRSSGPGIAMNNEKLFFTSLGESDSEMVSNVNIYNNLVAGTNIGLAIWGEYQNTYYRNMKIVHNIFVDNELQFASSGYERHSGTVIANNIFMSISSGREDIGGGLTVSGVKWAGNYWSSAPKYTEMRGTGDVYGGGRLSRMSGWNNISQFGQIGASDFKPVAESSTLGEAVSLSSLMALSTFFSGQIPSGSDIGATMFGGSSSAGNGLVPLPPNSVSIQ